MPDALDTPRFLSNPALDRRASYGPGERWILNHERHREVAEEIGSWPGYEVTPLLSLPAIAESVGVGALSFKDESQRFGLGSFKALGGAYGVLRVIQDEAGRLNGESAVTGLDVMAGRHRELASQITVTCATDGNHGRSVAWGANIFGTRAMIYLPDAVSPHRASAIAALGAEIVRTATEYDDTVRRAQRDARQNGWFVVSDTSYAAYVNIPRDVMQGYTVMVAEVLDQFGADRPTHVFLQGGVGGLAAAFVGHLWEKWGDSRPVSVVVEPHCADCLFRSATAGRPATITDVHGTIMAGLACGEVSLLAWHLLERGADAFLTVDDAAARHAMQLLAGRTDPIVSGESGAAGLAGFLSAAATPHIRNSLALDAASRVLVIGTEGATDPEIYRAIVTDT